MITASTVTDATANASDIDIMPLNEVRERIRVKLHHELGRYFDYPQRARARGWEGDVILSLQLNAGGGIENVKVDRSSGYALLDNDAADTVIRVGHLEGVTAWLGGRSIELQLPVKYRLTMN